MSELSVPFEVAINATSLHTGRRFRFKQTDMGDSTYGITPDIHGITVAFAAACSAAFPMLFAAIPLDTTDRIFWTEYWDQTRKQPSRPPLTLWLTDGGVYDNLGSEPILRTEESFLVIDASKFAEKWNRDANANYFARTWRPLETGLDQIVSLRRRLLYEHALRVGGLLLMLRDPVTVLARESRHGRFGNDDRPPVEGIPELAHDIQGLLATLRTDLDAFHEVEVACLMWAGAARMDLAVRRYLPQQSLGSLPMPPAPPDLDPLELRAVLMAGQKRTYLGRA